MNKNLPDRLKIALAHRHRGGVVEVFGKPVFKRPERFVPNQVKEVWDYKDQEGNKLASIYFDDSDSVVAAIWTPGRSEDILNTQQVLDHFKQFRFNSKEVGWDKQGHYYSNDTQYTDEENGISFYATGADKGVLFISFSLPANRLPAKQ